jgi:hypothetical protein
MGLTVFFLSSTILGAASQLLSLIIFVGVAYVLAVEPRRRKELARIRQAREAPTLAASVVVRLRATGSRSRTILGLSSADEDLSLFLMNLQRSVLLGIDVGKFLESRKNPAASLSITKIIQSMGTSSAANLEESGLELESILSSASLGEETKTPVFIAASFFSPIMILLLAAISHSDPLSSLPGLFFLNAFILDIALAGSSSETERLRA